MKYNLFFVLILLLHVFPVSLAAAGEKIRLLEAPKDAPLRQTKQEIQEKTWTESRKAPDGGFFADPEIVERFAAMEYRYTGGRYEDHPICFRLLMPKSLAPGRKYPLVVWLHGVGESGEDNRRQLAHLQLMFDTIAGPDRVDFFFLATQCPLDNTSWLHSISSKGKGDARLTITHEILETIITEYPVDEERITVAGVCSGGTAAWSYAAMYPEKFAAILPSSSHAPVEPVSSFTQISVWAFNNKYDTQVNWRQPWNYILSLNQSGGNAYMTLNPRSASHDTWTEAMRDHKAIVWLTSQKKGALFNPPPGTVCYSRPLYRSVFMFYLPLLILAFVFLRKKFKPD